MLTIDEGLKAPGRSRQAPITLTAATSDSGSAPGGNPAWRKNT